MNNENQMQDALNEVFYRIVIILLSLSLGMTFVHISQEKERTCEAFMKGSETAVSVVLINNKYDDITLQIPRMDNEFCPIQDYAATISKEGNTYTEKRTVTTHND